MWEVIAVQTKPITARHLLKFYVVTVKEEEEMFFFSARPFTKFHPGEVE